ncbi:MAG: hypothetical protein HYZ16_05690 [Bacteroidetes bacterium]|nr:hypothetical protein [Bacteroidota bacterium]
MPETEKLGSLKNIDKMRDDVARKHQDLAQKRLLSKDVVIDVPTFEKHWQALAENLLTKGKSSLHLAMTQYPVMAMGHNKFELPVSNMPLLEALSMEKVQLLERIQEQLGGAEVKLVLRLERVDEEDKPKVPTTPREKYEFMVAINPELKTLMDELGLDFR